MDKFESARQKPLEPEAAADHVQKAAPRLVTVAAATAISFGLFDGVNRVLLNLQDIHDSPHQIMVGYRGDASSITVIRLAALLDGNPRMVSFQSVYRCLKRPEVVDILVRRACDTSPLTEALADHVEENIRDSVERFLATYRGIAWHDLHGRLQHFRNRGLAHLTPEEIEKRVSFGEIRDLVRSVTILGECLVPFYRDGVPLRLDEIADWSEMAKSVWEAALRGFRN
jgi:hypothetical protein